MQNLEHKFPKLDNVEYLMINILEYALQNSTISYDKIKHDIFEMLAILEMFSQIFHQFLDDIIKTIISLTS